MSTNYVQSQIDTLVGSGSYTHRLGALESIPGLVSRDWSDLLLGSGDGDAGRLFRLGILQDDGFEAVDNQFVLLLAEAGVIGMGLYLTVLLGPLVAQATPNWLRVLLPTILAMSLIFDVLAWTSNLTVFVLFIAMADSTRGGIPNREANSSDQGRQQGADSASGWSTRGVA